MMRYVFVSHANLDKPALKPVLDALLAAGIPLWIDRPGEIGLAEHRLVLRGIRPGADWDAEIRRAYESAACVLFVLSRNSNNPERSDSLFREFDHGIVSDKLVMARLDDIGRDEMSGAMRIRQAIDLNGFSRDKSVGLDILVGELRRFVLGDGVARAPTSQTRPKRFGPLLPYLCDRRTQRRRFREAVEAELEREVVRPQMFFVVGEDSQCADKFVQQLFDIELPDLVQRSQLSGPVETKLLRWPTEVGPRADADEIKDHLGELEYELTDQLGLKPRAGVLGIQRRLERQNGVLFVYFDINLRKWNDGHRRLLGEWISWWSHLNTAGRRYPIVVVGRFCYPGQRIWPFGGISPTVRVLDDLAGLSKSASDRVMTAILPQLGHVSYEDIDAWIDENADFAAEAPPDLRQRMRKYFTGALGIGERTVPMSQAASFLRTIMDEMKISADARASRSAA